MPKHEKKPLTISAKKNTFVWLVFFIELNIMELNDSIFGQWSSIRNRIFHGHRRYLDTAMKLLAEHGIF